MLAGRQGFNPKKAKKTGTTIAGIIFKDGVVLGADTRATSGPIVADKNCEKIHYLAPNIFCCGAGTSADCENVTEMMSSNLTLHRLSTGADLVFLGARQGRVSIRSCVLSEAEGALICRASRVARGFNENLCNERDSYLSSHIIEM